MHMRKKLKGIVLLSLLMILCTGCGNKELKEHYELGNQYLENGQYEDALLEFDQAYNSDTNEKALEYNKEVYRCQGIAYYKMGDYENAITMFKYALGIPYNSEIDLDILKYKILAEEALGDYEQAVIDFEAAIALDLADFELYFGKFFAQKEIGDRKGATETLERALTLGGKGDEYKLNLSKTYYYMEQYEVAISGFRELKAILPEAYYFLGDCYYQKREYDKAIEYFETAIEQDMEQDKGLIYNQLGNCYLAEEEYETALSYFEQGQEVENTIWTKPLMYNEIIALEKQKKYAKALEACEEYLAKYPNDAAVLKEKQFLETRVSK